MQIEFTPRGLLANLFRQRRKLLAVFFLFVLGGIIYVCMTKPAYEADGSLLIRFGRDTPAQITQVEGNPSVISQDDRREMMQSNVDIMQSRNLLFALVREIGPEKLYPGIAERAGNAGLVVDTAIRQLLKSDLSVKSSQLSNVIDIRIENESPELAAYAVHRLMEMFIARQSAIYNTPQTDFLAEQVKQSATKLAQSQQQLKDFKAQKGISSIEGELGELLRQKSDTGTLSLESMDSAWDRLSGLQSEETRLLGVYRADSPQVQRAHENVMLAQNQLRRRQGELKARTDNASSRITRRVTMLEAQRNRYNDLLRQVDIDEKNYKNYQLRSEEARMNEKLNQKNISSVAVIDEPVVPLKPIHPRKTLIITLCLLFGTVLGIGGAMISETFDQRFSSPRQVGLTLGIPVMACFNRDREAMA